MLKWSISFTVQLHQLIIFDFILHIKAIVAKNLVGDNLRIHSLLPRLIAAAQQFSRNDLNKHNNIVVPVSLRDVERSVHLTGWFYKISGKHKVLNISFIKVVILTWKIVSFHYTWNFQ